MECRFLCKQRCFLKIMMRKEHVMNREKSLLTICCLAGTALLSPIEAGDLIFQEDFDHYGYRAGNFNEGSNFFEGVFVSEEPGSLKRLAIHPKDGKYLTAFKNPLLISEKDRTGNFTFTFQVRPEGGDLNKAYTVNLFFAPRPDAPKKEWKKVDFNISSTGCSFNGAFGKSVLGTMNLRTNMMDLKPFFDGYEQWYQFRITANRGFLEATVTRDVPQLEARAFIPEDYVLVGLNFGSKMPVAFDDLKIYRDAPVPTPRVKEPYSFDAKEQALVWTPLNEKSNCKFSIRKVGYPGKIVLKFNDGTEKPAVYSLTAEAQQTNEKKIVEVSSVVDGKLVKKKTPQNVSLILPDAAMNLSGPGINVHYRTVPQLQYRFTEGQKREMLGRYFAGGFEKASEHAWTFSVIQTGKECQLWIDGNFIVNVPLNGKLKNVTAYAPLRSEFKTLNEPSIDAMSQTLELDPVKGFDTGVCKENLGSFYLECDGYLSRSPFNGMPDCYLKRIPSAQYIAADVICSLGKNDPSKSTDVTVRLTRYRDNGGRSSEAAASETVTLPRTAKDPLPANVKRIGKNRFQVRFHFPIGKIQDLLFMEKDCSYLEFEVLGGLYEKNNYYLSRNGKPALRPSNVVVHGIKLEKSPVSMFVKHGNSGNIFYPDEQPCMTAELTSLTGEDCVVEWVVKDVYGKIVEQALDKADFRSAGETASFKHDFKNKSYGYYDVTVTLKRDAASQDSLVDFKGSYVCLAPDTRKAGYESPYLLWNFSGAHGTPSDKKVIGNLLRRMGVRRVTGGYADEKDAEEFGLTLGHFSSLSPRGKTPEERQKYLDEQIKSLITKYPHTPSAMIFHESAGGPIPLELIGGKTLVDEACAERDKALADRAMEIASAWRRNAPHIKLVVGNTGYSIGGLGRLFRAHYPADMIDYMGEESVGMTIPPERSVAYPSWMLRKLAEIYGYTNVQPEACYEWKSRVRRDFESSRQHAAMRVRDILVGYAWNYKLLPVIGLSEMANSYQSTIWGDGAFSRWPLFQPYPVFAATAVQTQVLDCVKPLRLVPIGSPTVYLLEFQRGKEFVYAAWTVRGELKAKVDFGGANVIYTGCYGETHEFKANELVISEEPCYLTASAQIKSASAELTRTYPFEQYPGMENAKVATAMDKAEDWLLVQGEDKRVTVPHDQLFMTALQPGKFDFSAVKDEVKGDCIEVKLKPEGECAELMREYGFIRMKTPAVFEGKPNTLGVWVKGNSSWGKLYFEIEDADGEIWLSAGTGGYGCQVYDWPERMALNFDGWHFVQFPLTGLSPVKNHTPGENQWQWQCDRTGDGVVTYPIKLKGIGFALSRKTLNLVKMEDVKELGIRFKDFSAY